MSRTQYAASLPSPQTFKTSPTNTRHLKIIKELVDDNVLITSVAWSPVHRHVAIGTDDNQVILWDAKNKEVLRKYRSNSDRVSSISWQSSFCFSSAGRDATIFHHDVRIPPQWETASTLVPCGHQEEICGLKWSPDGTLLASGSSDHLVSIWDPRRPEEPLYKFLKHKSAVRALAWCPWIRNLLASGGGTEDSTVRFWEITTGSELKVIETGAQVTSILWLETSEQLITSHGYRTGADGYLHNVKDNIRLWDYPSMHQVGVLLGHDKRVLHTALSPDGTTLISLSSDETLVIWKRTGNKFPIQRKERHNCSPFDPNKVYIR